MKEYHEPKIPDNFIEQEKELRQCVYNALADYTEAHETDRRVLIAVIFALCLTIFTEQTGFDIQGQCKEIDHFCRYLKKIAKAKKLQ